MARKGPGVRSATIAKAAPQVVVGCGYLADVIISPSGWRAVPFKSGEGLKMPTSENRGVISYSPH